MYSDNMDDPMLCLSWNDHMDNILNVFMEQLTSENLVDVTIMCEGKFLKAHKMVLSACSPYLHDILTMHNVPDPVIIMNNVKFSHMKQVIDFMYCGQIKVSVDDFKSVVSLAQSLKIKGLSEEGSVNHEVNEVGPETCVQPIIEEPPFHVNKVKFEGRTGRRKKRPVQNKPPVDTQYQQIPVEQSIAKEIKTEPAEIDETEPQCTVEDSSNNFEEYTQWSEEERKPDRMMLDYLRNSSENPASGFSETNISPATSAKKRDSFTEWPSDENSSEVPRTEISLENWTRAQHNTDGDRIRRPPNAFMIFSNEWRKKLSKIYPFETNAELSRRLGEMWNSLDQKGKDVYFTAAKLADQEHKEKYPGYHYSPKGRPRKRNQVLIEKPFEFPPVKFAKVFLTSEDDHPIPVLIALDNPEYPYPDDNHLEKNEGGRKRDRKKTRANPRETTSE